MINYHKLIKQQKPKVKEVNISELCRGDIIEISHAMIMTPLYDKIIDIREDYVLTEVFDWKHFKPFKKVFIKL